MVHALKMGWMKTNKEMEEAKKKQEEVNYFMLWRDEDEVGNHF